MNAKKMLIHLLFRNFSEAVKLGQAIAANEDVSDMDVVGLCVLYLSQGRLHDASEVLARSSGDGGNDDSTVDLCIVLLQKTIRLHQDQQEHKYDNWMKSISLEPISQDELILLAACLRLYFAAIPTLAVTSEIRNQLEQRISVLHPAIALEIAYGCATAFSCHGFEVLAIDILRIVTLTLEAEDAPGHFVACIASLMALLAEFDQGQQAKQLGKSYRHLNDLHEDSTFSIEFTCAQAYTCIKNGEIQQAITLLNMAPQDTVMLQPPQLQQRFLYTELLARSQEGITVSEKQQLCELVAQCRDNMNVLLQVSALELLHEVSTVAEDWQDYDAISGEILASLTQHHAFSIQRRALQLLASDHARINEYRKALLCERAVQRLDKEQVQRWRNLQVESFNQMNVGDVLLKQESSDETYVGYSRTAPTLKVFADNYPIAMAILEVEENYHRVGLRYCNSAFEKLSVLPKDEFLQYLEARTTLIHELREYRHGQILKHMLLREKAGRRCFSMWYSGLQPVGNQHVHIVFLEDVQAERVAELQQQVAGESARAYLDLVGSVFDVVKDNSLLPTSMLIDAVQVMQSSNSDTDEEGREIVAGCAKSVVQINKLFTSLRRLASHNQSTMRHSVQVDLVKLVHQCVKDKLVLANEFLCELTLEAHVQSAQAIVDIEAFDLAMDFVLQSAIKHSRGRYVDVHVKEVATSMGVPQCQISIVDSGKVMTDNRSFTSPQSGVGYGRKLNSELEMSGVGFSISQRLLESQSGKLSVERAQAGGIAVNVTMPLS